MHSTYKSNFLSFGNTPCVRLSKFDKGLKNKIYAKIESRNPGFSIKDRTAYGMIDDALLNGRLKNGMEIIEPTSGNTGIALALIGNSLNFKVNLVMPESMSIERISLLKMLGANVILTSGRNGMKDSIDKTYEIIKNDPDKYFYPSQFDNPAAIEIHRRMTGPEIHRDLSGKVDIFVAGVGTGGTISGVGRFLKAVLSDKVRIVAVEPAESPAIASFLKNQRFTAKSHKIQGIGAGFIPKNLDLSVIDEVVGIGDEEALEFTRDLFKKEGIIAGISSGAALCAALKIAKRDSVHNKNIALILPDTGERYISTELFK